MNLETFHLSQQNVESFPFSLDQIRSVQEDVKAPGYRVVASASRVKNQTRHVFYAFVYPAEVC